MDEKRLSEIEVILDECETTNELRRIMGSTGPLRELVAEIRILKEYADKLANGLPEGMLPKDVEVLRKANQHFANENHMLREALAFYADDKMYDWHDKEMGVSYTELD